MVSERGAKCEIVLSYQSVLIWNTLFLGHDSNICNDLPSLTIVQDYPVFLDAHGSFRHYLPRYSVIEGLIRYADKGRGAGRAPP